MRVITVSQPVVVPLAPVRGKEMEDARKRIGREVGLKEGERGGGSGRKRDRRVGRGMNLDYPSFVSLVVVQIMPRHPLGKCAIYAVHHDSVLWQFQDYCHIEISKAQLVFRYEMSDLF